MKVILLRDVAKIGRRNQVVEVPDGFALNKLIPKKDAEPATPGNMKKIANLNTVNENSQAQVLETLKKVAAATEEAPLTIPMQANEKGHLFQSVHTEDVIAAAKKVGLSISKDYLVIDTPIKDIGLSQLTLQYQGNKFQLTINVVAK